ncbi:unnamed protein product [Phytophthora lilii]|uniref:Unnamed protein product n=1 Tax=Phytophthora lilii TaxID=2077276 RepID=A0A9W6U5W5_9STRA|nr:unnamed protein product [Phytophthora lilii]
MELLVAFTIYRPRAQVALVKMTHKDQENKKSLDSPYASTDGNDSTKYRPVKKRKATYLIIKQEVQKLEAHLAILKEQVGLTGSSSPDKFVTSNMVLSSMLRQQQLLIANARADLTACTVSISLASQSHHPLYSFIHLGVDHESHRKALSAIRDSKIQNGIDYIKVRSRHLDLLEPYISSEQYIDAHGNLCCSLFDVTQFSGAKSVKAVYNAAGFHFRNEEISISERLGYITVRDDFNMVGDNFSNCRLSSADESGVKTEMNTVPFSQYEDAEQSETDEPFAVLVRDSVDVDELYPYNSDECVRKDQLGAILLTAAKRKKNVTKRVDNDTGDTAMMEELVVVMRRAAFVKIHHPAFPLPERTQQALLKGIMAWCDVMLTTIQGVLATSS